MNKKKVCELKEAIRECEMKIINLKPHLNGEKPVLNESYNRLLIERAIYKTELNKTKITLGEKIVRLFRRNERKVIADWFK